MLRVGIDCVSEQEELHDREGDDQAQGHWIASNLDPFLVQHGEEPPKGKPVHDDPFAWDSKWMNTSSSRGSTSCHAKESSSNSAIARSSAARPLPATWTDRQKTAAASMPVICRNRRAASSTASPAAYAVSSKELSPT